MTVKHEQRNIKLCCKYCFAGLVSVIACSFLKDGFAALVAHQGKVYGFDLAEDELLGRTTVEPAIFRVT